MTSSIKIISNDILDVSGISNCPLWSGIFTVYALFKMLIYDRILLYNMKQLLLILYSGRSCLSFSGMKCTTAWDKVCHSTVCLYTDMHRHYVHVLIPVSLWSSNAPEPINL